MEEEDDDDLPDFLNTPRGAGKEQPDTIADSEVEKIVSECRRVIQAYSLERLVKDAKTADKFTSLSEPDREMFCAGIIKLGEALTFCRDRNQHAVKASGISEIAKQYANLRNYFIHKYMYNQHLPIQQELQEGIKSICLIDILSKKLLTMEQSGFSTLSKKIVPGKNSFDFEYNHLIECLKHETSLLQKKIDPVKDEKDIDEESRIYLDNRIRNILSIMLDLLDEKMTNKNKGSSCKLEKKAVAEFNAEFIAKNEKFADFFLELRGNRNALSHLDASLTKPYQTDAELIEFAKELNQLLTDGYLLVEEAVLSSQKQVKEPAPRDTQAPVTPAAATNSPTQKKPKTGLEALLVYNATKEKNDDKKDTDSQRKKTSKSSFSMGRK